jgi:adenosyl cobinamide kinase/adenosyl cobinamide phosphate guanylyltransferase
MATAAFNLSGPTKENRTVIIGGPRTGKTTLANALAQKDGRPVISTDGFIEMGWSEASQYVATDVLERQPPWIVEGTCAIRALRKWLEQHDKGSPCDDVYWLLSAKVALSKSQVAMFKGCCTIWASIRDEVARRGVVLHIAD